MLKGVASDEPGVSREESMLMAPILGALPRKRHQVVGRRHIGDFSGWKDHDAYHRAFERLLRDLRAATPST